MVTLRTTLSNGYLFIGEVWWFWHKPVASSDFTFGKSLQSSWKRDWWWWPFRAVCCKTQQEGLMCREQGSNNHAGSVP